MKKLLRTLGLVLAFGLVSLAAVDAFAWPYSPNHPASAWGGGYNILEVC